MLVVTCGAGSAVMRHFVIDVVFAFALASVERFLVAGTSSGCAGCAGKQHRQHQGCAGRKPGRSPMFWQVVGAKKSLWMKAYGALS